MIADILNSGLGRNDDAAATLQSVLGLCMPAGVSKREGLARVIALTHRLAPEMLAGMSRSEIERASGLTNDELLRGERFAAGLALR
jgi:hypothetical protein